MHCVSYALLILWLQAILALYQIHVPELEFLSKNLSPMECLRFYKLLRRQTSGSNENQRPQRDSYRHRESPDCKKLLFSWLKDPEEPIDKAHEYVELNLRQIGRSDLAHWLGYNIVRQRQLPGKSEKRCQQNLRGNTALRARFKEDDRLLQGPASAGLTSDQTNAENNPPQSVLHKVVITVVVVLSMTTLCLCCYKFLYARMLGGHFTNFRYKFAEPRLDLMIEKEFDEESWLQQDHRQTGRGRGSCCGALSNTGQSWWNSVENLKRTPFSAVEYLKKKVEGYADYSRDKRSRQIRLLITRLQKTCPTQRKIIHLNRRERCLLYSLTDVEKDQLPATDSDFKFLIASDREKRKLLAGETRREFLIELRKRLERIGPDCSNVNLTLNETERKFIRKLSSSERLLLPIMDKDLELLASSPLEKRQVVLRQMACKLAGISRDDRKYLELETGEKKFLKEVEEKEKKKLGVTDSEFRFLVASKSQRNVMQQRLESRERDQRINEIRKKLAGVNYDVSRLELSQIEHSSFLSLNSYELARLGLTDEHVKFYAASDSERKVIWPSPSQHRNLRLNTLQTKLSKLPWKDCTARLTSSEHKLLASLTPREQDNLRISDSEKNFMLSTNSEKELIQRQRKIGKLEAKIRDFNTVTMTESERGLILSLSPSEMQMLNIDSTNKSSLVEKKSRTAIERESKRKIETIKDRILREGLANVRLTNSEKCFIESLSKFDVDSCNLTPSELSFLLRSESEQRIDGQEPNCRHQVAIQCSGSGTRQSASTRDIQINTSPHLCHREMNNASNFQVHSHCKANFGHDTQSNFPEYRPRVQFKEPDIYSNDINACDGDGQPFLRESTDDSELSETYDELGMLFSQHMKQQARPCQRKYCLLGRHLKRGSLHDARQCQVRHYCCRGYPTDQRPSCSSGNVCKDTYDEFHLMHARPDERKQLNSSMFERRKQFLDQPCQKCYAGQDNYTRTN